MPIKVLSKFFKRDEMALPSKEYEFTNDEITRLKIEIYR